jgi:hypothetical protein
MVVARNPPGLGDGECRSGNVRNFRRERCSTHRHKHAGCALARVFSGDAFRQLAVRCALAEADFVERPALIGGLRGNLGASERANDKLENERIGGEPADRPPPNPEISCPRLLHCEPLSDPSRNCHSSAMRPDCRNTVAKLAWAAYFSFAGVSRSARKAICLLEGLPEICQGIRQQCCPSFTRQLRRPARRNNKPEASGKSR